MTTLIDVLVKPYCQTYLKRAGDEVRSKAGDIPFLIMQSNGGVVKHETAGNKPVTMLLSGPAAGVLGAVHMARMAGYKDILTLDVGGTSTDVSLVTDLTPQFTSASMIENYPVKTPMLDIVTVGTGGGSLAWTDDYGGLKVGPRSAGADPGPICYRRGGSQPTTTDAAVSLGRLPGTLVGGEIDLDVGAARAAFDVLGHDYEMSAEAIADGVLEIAVVNMVHGIRQVTTTRGRDPGKYTLVAFGGAGALFATEVADFLGIQSILVPPNPGNLSAYGLHICDVKQDYIRTLVRQQSTAVAEEIDHHWRELEEVGRSEILSEGVEADDIAIIRSADMRYVGEGHEVNVAIPDDLGGLAAIERMWSNFHGVHRDTFGYDYAGEQDVELVNLRVQAVGKANRPPVREHDGAVEGLAATTRPVYWRDGGWIECPIHRRASLAAGRSLVGPAIFEEYGSTVVVPASWKITCGNYGNLILEKQQ